MIKVVIDTNVLVSALLFDGTPGKLVALWKEKHLQPLCSKEIMDEYLRVLTYPKFGLTDVEIDYLLTVEILPWFHPVTVKKGEPFIKQDPQDDFFIWCAVEGKAEAIISGDNHLLKMKEPPVTVLTINEFLKFINDERGKKR
jgi:putative PIN family toxin of toxin-antitoxin system